MKIFKYIRKYIQGYRILIFVLIILSFILSGLTLLIPKMLGDFIDFLNNGTSYKILYKYVFMFFIIYLIKIVISFLTNMISAYIKVNVSYNINKKFIEHIQKISLKFFYDKDTIYITDRVNQDSNVIVDFYIGNLVGILVNFLSLLIITIIMIKINYILALVILFIIPIYCILYKVMKNKLYNTTFSFKESQNKFFVCLNNQIKDIKFIKINCIYKFLIDELDKSFKFLVNNLVKYCKVSFCFGSIGTFINSLISVFLILYGGLSIIKGNMTVGNFISINTYFGAILGYISYFIGFGSNYQEALVACNRLIEIEIIKEESKGNLVLKNIDTIQVKNLKFSFSNDFDVIDNFNYEIKKNNIYLIKGKNGVGKSTFINLILGLYEDYVGDILFNNISIKNLDMNKLRKNNISVLEQEPNIMELNIIDNVKLHNDIDGELVEELYNLLGIKNIEESHQYNVIKKESVSGGEKQKISLVRAISKKSDLLILDEPTSALDGSTAQKLKEILKELKKDKIILIISHDSIFDEICDYNIRINDQVS